MNYKIGNVIEGVVSGISSYGIFVTIDKEYSGLIHISEISSHFVKDILDYVSIGEHILCEIRGVDEVQKHMKLSIKNFNYKLIPTFGNIKDTSSGFRDLQMQLPIWIRQKLDEEHEN